MRREVSLEEISDGRLYELNDMVKADCQDCAGCHDCCEGMGDSVVLDPMDVYRLCTNLGKTPQELVSAGLIQFDAMDGNILPHLCMSGKKQCCVFLSEQGRCSIHECKKTSRSKIKVKKWIDTPDLRQYEKFVADWHYFLLDVQEVLYNATDAQLIKNLNLYVVNRFYMKTYEVGRDFYEQFEERLTEGKQLLSLA